MTQIFPFRDRTQDIDLFELDPAKLICLSHNPFEKGREKVFIRHGLKRFFGRPRSKEPGQYLRRHFVRQIRKKRQHFPHLA